MLRHLFRNHRPDWSHNVHKLVSYNYRWCTQALVGL